VLCFSLYILGFLTSIVMLLLKLSLQLELLVSLKTIAFWPGLRLLWLLCTSNQLLITGSKLNHD